MFIALSASNPDPMYRQMADQIKDAVASGELPPGEKLPSIREMALTLDISVITVKRAYLDLEKEGYLLTRAGMGSFVAEVDRDRLRREKLEELRGELTGLLDRARKFGVEGEDIAAILNEIRRS